LKCEKCEEKAIITNPPRCKKHFNEYFLETLQETIDEFHLFTKEDKLVVAVSGGKDSLALLHSLKKLGYDPEGIFIDEGIKNYREKSIEDLNLFIQQNSLKLKKISFEEENNFTLDEAMTTKQFHACMICGTLRRYLLNKYTKEFDVLATGHNMDDEAQTVLINLARANTELLLRGGPKSEPKKSFTQKVKPFYYLTEKQILTYTLINNIRVDYGECPYAYTSYRAKVRDLLNKEENEHPGTKKNILKNYLLLKKRIHTEKSIVKVQRCVLCGEASKEKICKACQIKKQILSKKNS